MADKDLYWFRDFTKEKRNKLAESGAALPDGSFPIEDESDLENAIHAVGRAKDEAKAKSHIIKRAKALGKTDMLPEDWEGSTKKAASEPTADDVHVPSVPQPKAKTKKRDLTRHFLTQLYSLIKEKKGVVANEEEYNAMVNKARASAGGKTKSDNRMSAVSASEGINYSKIIEMVNAELREEYSNPLPYNMGSYPYAREVYDDHVICSDDEGGFYSIPYTISADGDDIEFGEPEKVEQEFMPKAAGESNILDLCADGHPFCLFNELKDFADPPDRIPLLPKPGTYTHEKYGKVVITKQRNQHFTDNVNNAVYQSNLPIDFEHELDLSGAVGYITKAAMNEDGSVDATNVEWTDRGKKAFEENRFKYFSPKWWDKWTDPMTEDIHRDVVIGGALTTRPFFKEKALRPLIANEKGLAFSDTVPKTNGQTVVLNFTQGVKQMAVTKEQIETARALVKAADAKTSGEATKEQIEAARALVASEDAKAAKEPEVPKDFAERLATAEASAKTATEEAKQAKEDAKRANERADASDKANRAIRFKELSKDWPGETEAKVNMLEHLATFSEKGEDDELFKKHVETQNAATAQLKDAGLFTEMGSSASGAPEGAEGELMVKAREIQAAKPTLTHAQAFTEACTANKDIYDRYRTEQRRSLN